MYSTVWKLLKEELSNVSALGTHVLINISDEGIEPIKFAGIPNSMNSELVEGHA